jgi:hypothetical protein
MAGRKPLGPYADRLRAMLFEGRSYDPMLLVSRSAFVRGKEELRLGVLPHRYQESGIRFWRFLACGLIFDLKLDNRPTPPAMAALAVNDSSEVLLHLDFPQDVFGTPGLAASLLRMGIEKKR